MPRIRRGRHGFARVSTVAFQGIEAVPVDVQVMVAPGKIEHPHRRPARQGGRRKPRARAGGAPCLRPVDAGEEGDRQSRARRPAQGRQPLRSADRAWPDGGARRHSRRCACGYVVLGELSLDGTIAAVAGALPAAIGANAEGKGLICPHACGPEAAWAGADIDILAPRSLIAIANHFRGTQVLSRPEASVAYAGEQPARPRRHQGPGKREARAGGRSRRRPQSPDGRPARLRQIDAGAAPALDPAAAVSRRNCSKSR